MKLVAQFPAALAGAVLTCSTALAAQVSTSDQPARSSTASQHLVFAHYMVCYATHSESLESYQREIREAQAAGIDGFALNVGAWSREPHYPRCVRLIYRAAQELGTGFKLFFSVDMSNVPDILDMVRTYARHPNQFVYRGRIVISTFSQERLAWKEQILTPLKQEGIDVFFVPYFYPRPQATELPDYATVTQLLQHHAGTANGLFYFGAAGTSQQLAAANTAYAKALREAGLLFMASYTPTYWGHTQRPGRRYFETEGGEGTAHQWQALIVANPNWVEIATWNDFNESSYVCPVENPGRYFAELLTPPRPCHAGYLELSKYFIAWYKTGRQPPISRDSLFYFYRPHPRDALATRDDRPVTSRIGEVTDTLYVTTFLTAPAELSVYSGDTQTRHSAAAGMQHLRIPFAPGPQRFELTRHNERILAAQGDPIDAEIERYNFFTTTGFAYGPVAPPGR
jgi:hypothetical protein